MKYLLFILLLSLHISCKKQDAFLDVKPNKNDVTPSKLSDYQAMLDNDNLMNSGTPALGILGADNYYVNYTVWQSRSATERNAYIWAKDVFEGAASNDWKTPYQAIAQANIVLDGLAKMDAANTAVQQTIAAALFYRAYHYYNLLQLFAKPYHAATAVADAGLPLLLQFDLHAPVQRAAIQTCYYRLIEDLENALPYLPDMPLYKTRPGKAAALGLLARYYLHTAQYVKAGNRAEAALQHVNNLLDYAALNASASYPFPTYQNNNKEVIFYAQGSVYVIMTGTNMIVDTSLYKSYHANDLRKQLFYRSSGGNYFFKGSYTGSSAPFTGLAVNELYLISAEAAARTGNTTHAMQQLNNLLIKRFKTGTFVPYAAATAEDALQLIIAERRKELPFNGSSRWEDLRRLNSEPWFAQTLRRVLNGQQYELPPGDKRYVYPIPDNEILLSGIEQNPR